MAVGLDYGIGVECGGGALLSAAHAFTAAFEGWIGRPPSASFTATLVQRYRRTCMRSPADEVGAAELEVGLLDVATTAAAAGPPPARDVKPADPGHDRRARQVRLK